MFGFCVSYFVFRILCFVYAKPELRKNQIANSGIANWLNSLSANLFAGRTRMAQSTQTATSYCFQFRVGVFFAGSLTGPWCCFPQGHLVQMAAIHHR